MIRSAYLRVYVPVEDSSAWVEHVPSPRHGVITVGEYGVWQEPLVEDAFRADWQGRAWVCPRRPRLRMLEGLLAFRSAYPGLVGSMLAPEEVVVRAAAEVAAIQRREPDARSHILTSSWHVPLRWFAAFTSDERELAGAANGATTVRYRTSLGDARRRLRDAAATLNAAGFDDSVVEPVTDVVDWLGGFAAEAMLELDYGSVAGMFSDADLALDDSAAEIESSLEALAAGDMERAGSFYASAATRWAGAQAVVYGN